MKAVVDHKIPYIQGQIEQLVDDVVYLSGNDIDREAVRDADILVVRTRTKCDRQLLEGSAVRLIVTATIGFDHIDMAYCESAGIEGTNCPGCNARSVSQYVHLALALTGNLRPQTVGIVGVGHVGTLVACDLKSSGMRLLLCDPPRKERGELCEGQDFTDFPTICREADIITFHTPLTRAGKHATWHLFNEKILDEIGRKPLIINASRGEVVDTDALLFALQRNIVRDAVVDTWEHEPDINRDLLQKAVIATPHIAGYSADGKANATRMVLMKIAEFIGKKFTPNIVLPTSSMLSTDTLRSDSDLLKSSPSTFETQRGNYPIRREY